MRGSRSSSMAGVSSAPARSTPAGRSRRLFVSRRPSRRWTASAVSRCWAPSCRLRTIRRRSVVRRLDEARARGAQALAERLALGHDGGEAERRQRGDRDEQLHVSTLCVIEWNTNGPRSAPCSRPRSRPRRRRRASRPRAEAQRGPDQRREHEVGERTRVVRRELRRARRRRRPAAPPPPGRAPPADGPAARTRRSRAERGSARRWSRRATRSATRWRARRRRSRRRATGRASRSSRSPRCPPRGPPNIRQTPPMLSSGGPPRATSGAAARRRPAPRARSRTSGRAPSRAEARRSRWRAGRRSGHRATARPAEVEERDADADRQPHDRRDGPGDLERVPELRRAVIGRGERATASG